MSEVILKAIQDLGEKAESNKTALEQKFQQEVDKLNTDLAAKGATIGEIREEVKELKAKAGQLHVAGKEVKSIQSLVRQEIGKLGDGVYAATKGENGVQMSTKAVAAMASANLSDNFISYLDYAPGMRPMGQTRFREFVRTIQSATDFVQFPRAASPVGEGAFARQTEGATKAQVDYDFTMESVTLTPIAGYATVSRQALRNIPFLQSYLPQTMLEDLLDKEDALFSASLVAAATGSTTTTGSNELEKLVHYIRNLRKAKFNPNAIAVDPDVWSNIILNISTGAGYNLPNVVTVDANGTVKILGRPVQEVNWLSGGNVIVGDWSKASIVESEGLSFRQSDSHASTFTANQVTFLLERTEDIAVFRPDAFVVADLIA